MPYYALLICDLVGEHVTRTSLETLRADVADLRQRLAESRSTAAQLPHRARYLHIATDFLERLLDLHDQLVDDVESEFASDEEVDDSRDRRPTR